MTQHTEENRASPLRALPLGRLEMATGLVWGLCQDAGPPLPVGAAADPRSALDARILAAVKNSPCCVSFSGGRDSSAVLALACAVARREGLPDPVPVTLRFTGIASAEESQWQQLVVDHLRLSEWEVIAVDEELDLLGVVAQRALDSHGLMWPPNVYFHVPILERARGGSLITGFDGDGLLGGWRWARAQAALHWRVRMEPRDLLRVAVALAPARVRRARVRPILLDAVPWLREGVRREVSASVRTYAATEPRRWDQRLTYYARRRDLRLPVHSLGLLGASHGVDVIHPLLDPEFLGALARHGGATGYPDRATGMRALFADVVPEKLLARSDKAEFGPAIWRGQSRSFAAAWDGTGVDPELIDPAALQDAWRAPSPLFGSSTLLHAAWLAAQPK